MPDSQIQTFHFRFVMYFFFALYNNRKSFQMSTSHSNRKCSKVVGISSDILGNVRKSSENRRKYSEVSRTLSEIPVMTSQKSHAFDLEKVGRYMEVWILKCMRASLQTSPLETVCIQMTHKTKIKDIKETVK